MAKEKDQVFVLCKFPDSKREVKYITDKGNEGAVEKTHNKLHMRKQQLRCARIQSFGIPKSWRQARFRFMAGPLSEWSENQELRERWDAHLLRVYRLKCQGLRQSIEQLEQNLSAIAARVKV